MSENRSLPLLWVRRRQVWPKLTFRKAVSSSSLLMFLSLFFSNHSQQHDTSFLTHKVPLFYPQGSSSCRRGWGGTDFAASDREPSMTGLECKTGLRCGGFQPPEGRWWLKAEDHFLYAWRLWLHIMGLTLAKDLCCISYTGSFLCLFLHMKPNLHQPKRTHDADKGWPVKIMT